MADRKTKVDFYTKGYAKGIPLGNKRAMKPNDIDAGMIIEGNLGQGVLVESIEKTGTDTNEFGEYAVYTIKVTGFTEGEDEIVINELATIIGDGHIFLAIKGQKFLESQLKKEYPSEEE